MLKEVILKIINSLPFVQRKWSSFIDIIFIYLYWFLAPMNFAIKFNIFYFYQLKWNDIIT